MALTPAQYQTLKSELNTDPRAYGYAPLRASGSDDALAALVNLVRDGTNIGPAISVKRADIQPSELLEALDIRDFPATPGQVNNMTLAASWFESISQARVIRLVNDAGTNTRVLGNLNRLVGDTNGSQTRLTALASRNGSRAEELFGRDTQITGVDVAIALRQTA